MSAPGSSVYFIAPVGGGLVKIGYSTNPSRRIGALLDASPVLLEILCSVPGCREQENALHTLFIKHWSHGEWFHPAPELLAFVAATKLAGGLPKDLPLPWPRRKPFPSKRRETDRRFAKKTPEQIAGVLIARAKADERRKFRDAENAEWWRARARQKQASAA